MTNSLPVRLDDLIGHITTNHPDGDALAQLSDACRIAMVLDEQADHLIGHFVDRARRSGASWSAIGQHMGVSKQAAQKRFVTGPGDFSLGDADDGKLSRFTGRTKIVLEKGHLTARNLKHSPVEPIHLLHGLAEEPSTLAAKVLESMGVTIEQLHDRVSEALDAPGQGAYATGDIPLSPDSVETLKLTVREALGMGHNYVGTEHLLLGLLAAEGTPAEILGGLGVGHDAAKERVLAALDALMNTKST
ncbi:Clp protease N-terminal domain-containing protein [Stackebrandtia nassauensis]|uniref:Clp domain protein n=1 Tax=Stackebrandtia nassauensis (strain DSM 44728 / CIP 108903 / NRRL B-16338 / NBRC 102104 / LLR-40K-21) TaxID=446470 RepID=D3Q1Y6_STANL|nr:Clp protease N-terminal domain-containing protein [Stackebrandtia nassauensis]ADD41853.1 Clp domain protein [Stackebrandtia nassauensis DSM 44728]